METSAPLSTRKEVPDPMSQMEREPELKEEMAERVPDATGVRRARFPGQKGHSSWGRSQGCHTP